MGADSWGQAVSGSTRLAALIESPVRHSLSPTILNAAFAAVEADWVFLVFDVPIGRTGHQAIAAVRELGIGGCR